jgi:uncharacterized membrane protein
MHSHGGTELPDLRASSTVVRVLALAVAMLGIAAAIGIAVLWPGRVPHGPSQYGAPGVSLVEATVTGVSPFDCGNSGMGPDNTPVPAGACANVSAHTDAGRVSFKVDPTRFVGAPLHRGDEVRLIRIAPKGQSASYEFQDFQRGMPLVALACAFGVVVVLIGRWRGLFALMGIGVTLAALFVFVLPALLSGQPAIPAAVVGSTAIMIAVLYLAHGVSVRTTSALFGTVFGIAFTAASGWAATSWTKLTGIGTEDDRLLVGTAPHLHLTGIVAASMVVAGLGVLNDVTVTQASAVWELRAADAEAGTRGIFRSAMRIGRDHIASSIYTLVFAYAGSAMTVMLLITAYQPGLIQVATTEQVAQEIVRTLVGAIGLVLAVPVTTAIAVALVPSVRTRGQHRDAEPGIPRSPRG